MLSPTQHTHLHALITGNEGELDNPNNPLTGAILTITNPNDGQLVYRAPLARMWRHEPDEPTVWLRPITTTPDPTKPVSKTNGFPLAVNRRRAISYTTVTLTDTGALRFDTTEGQVAIIEILDTVRDREEAERLQAWDTFTLVTLPDDLVDVLEQLNEDGWYDEWA